MTPERTLHENGVLRHEAVVSRQTVDRLRATLGAGKAGAPGSRKFVIGADVADLIGPRGEMGALASHYGGRHVRPVRILTFDKSLVSNWSVPWHQDRTIAVRQRIDVEGFGPWSTKDGVVHVEPPAAILAGMLTLRLFVDDCSEDNGPLEVAVGSHRHARVAAKDVAGLTGQSEIFLGTGQAGDVLLLKALAIHRSNRARSPSRRRVLHVDYAGVDLPAPLEWQVDTVSNQTTR